jgi:hypothetical protein
MRRLLAALLGMLIGYPLFAFVGYGAIGLFSGNHFDRSVEASMTAAFVIGPMGAIIGLIAGCILGSKKPIPADLPGLALRPKTDITGPV